MFDLEVRDAYEGRPGTKEIFCKKLGEMPNGAPYLLPVMVINGSSEGPTFVINATMHGDEVLGGEVVRQVFKRLQPDQISGRLIALPMANHSGVGTRTRRNIVEMYPGPHDMNRIFPGDAHGIMTERIAATIMQDFVDQADYCFDVHCASVGGEWVPYAAVPSGDEGFDPIIVQRARDMAVAFGAPLLVSGSMIDGSLVKTVLAQGKVGGMVEFGVANRSLKEEREFGQTGILNVLSFAGLLTGHDVESRTPDVIVRMHRLRSERAGFLHHRVALGDHVAEGQTIAALWNISGDLVDEFRAPSAGILCRMNSMAVVGTGDLVAYVGASE